jgi:tetrapyrrole methylase family protein / MazG family protein
MKKSIKKPSPKALFGELVDIMARLRGSEGCPWDKHQTHKTLLKYLFSEAKEVKQAVNNVDFENLAEELGDVLLQVVFHSRIAEENGLFSIADVVEGINKKLIRRHPHVFGNEKLKTPGDVLRRWEEIKIKEKEDRKKAKQSPAKDLKTKV